MKKAVAALLIMMMVLVTVACGGTPNATQETGKNGAEGKATLNRSKYFITVLTGPVEGIYFPVGCAFSKVINSLGYRSSTTATSASVQNINDILNGEGEIAMAMSDSVQQAIDAKGAFKGKQPAKDLRVMMGLWPNVCQIVTTANSGITKFTDLRGKRVCIGAPSSGVVVNAQMLYEAADMKFTDSKVEYLSYGDAFEQLKNGQADAVFVNSGLDNTLIRELASLQKIKFVPISTYQINSILSRYPYYKEWKIPKETYGTDEDTTTIAVMNVMLVAKSLPNEIVYDLLKGIYSENGLEIIGASHPIAKQEISLDNALHGITGTNMTLHPGAARFYADHGLKTH